VQPTHVIDITPVWDVKRKAIEEYESQLRYNDYLHMVAGLNAYRTIHCPSARYVEAFEAG
jgi:LmbE family N-acetylglucosaminyl deacetylase